MKELIEQIKLKADSWDNSTKETRARKGAYVDCLMMVKEASKNIVQPVVKSSFSREEVITLLDWLRQSKYHNQGCNGWNQYGASMYYGVSSASVLSDGEKNCF